MIVGNLKLHFLVNTCVIKVAQKKCILKTMFLYGINVFSSLLQYIQRDV